MSDVKKIRELIYSNKLILLDKYLDKYNVKIDPKDNILTHPIKTGNHKMLKILIEKAEIDIYCFNCLAHKTARSYSDKLALDILEFKYHPNKRTIKFVYPMGKDFSITIAPNTSTNTIKYLISKNVLANHIYVVDQNGKIVEYSDIYIASENKQADLYISVRLGSSHYPLLKRELESGWELNSLTFEQILKLFRASTNKTFMVERILQSNKSDTEIMTKQDTEEFIEIIEENKFYDKYDVRKFLKNPLLNLRDYKLVYSDPSI